MEISYLKQLHQTLMMVKVTLLWILMLTLETLWIWKISPLVLLHIHRLDRQVELHLYYQELILLLHNKRYKKCYK
mgnify:CR=1 FL=1